MIDIARENNKTVTTFSEPGKYVLTGSDGKITNSVHSTPAKTMPLTGNWEIFFDTKWGGPEKMQTDSLQSWTAFSDPGIKYYSGEAVYKKTFVAGQSDLKENKVLLDLGNVLEMASIKINGHAMPVRWSAPFVFDITAFLKTGSNQLEVEVVNLWPNRLIGDAKLPKEKRLTQTNIMKYDIESRTIRYWSRNLLGTVPRVKTKTGIIHHSGEYTHQ
jgi:hypothetical protein